MKKAKLAIMLGMLSLVLGLMCVGVFAAQSVSYSLTGTITYKVENSIELTSNSLSLSATANCSHVSATSGTGVTGSNISNYFKVIYNGSEQNQTQITSLISSGTLVVSTSNVTVSSGLVKMSNVSSSASASQNLSLSLKFSDSSAITKSGRGTITRTDAGQETNTTDASESDIYYTSWTTTSSTTGSDCRYTGYDTQTRTKSYTYTTAKTVVKCKNSACTYVYSTTGGESSSKTATETQTVSNSRTGSHSWYTSKSGTSATCQRTGTYATKTCSLCYATTGGGTYGPVDHDYSYKRTLTSGDCQTRSTYCYECLWCDDQLSTVYEGSYGDHDWEKEYETTTCSGTVYVNSSGVGVCDTCGSTTALGSYRLWYEGMSLGTCGEKSTNWTGVTYCTVCGTSTTAW